MLDVVLMEWEGVLADTRHARRDALVRALEEEGIASTPERVAAQADGRATTAAVLELLPRGAREDSTLAELVTMRATRAFAERLGKGFSLLPGARAFIEGLHGAVPIGIVTGATRAETEFVLRLAELDVAFSVIVSADDALAPAPAPAMFERALEHFARRRPVHPACVVALAASALPLRAARAAGVRTVAVGAPAHVSLEADGFVGSSDGLTVRELGRLAGLSAHEARS